MLNIYQVIEYIYSLSSTKSSISSITPQLFNNIIHLNISGDNLLHFFVIISPPVKKIDSEGAELAGIARKTQANRDKIGKSLYRSFQYSRGFIYI